MANICLMSAAYFCAFFAKLEAAELEIFPHGQEWEDMATLRHKGDAQIGPFVRAQAGDIVSLEPRARRGVSAPATARKVVDFPAPFAPTSVTTSPSST